MPEGRPPDRVFFVDAPFQVHLGVPDAEREEAQEIRLSLSWQIDVAAACRRDSIEDSVCYEAIWLHCREILEEQPFRLIESLAERVAEGVLARFELDSVTVRVEKPKALAHRGVAFAGIELTRRTRA